MAARRLGFWIAGLVMLGSAAAGAAGDPAAGAKLFRKCMICHSADAPKSVWGPHLVGIIGRPAASVEGFRGYSKAMKASGIVWDEATLDAYLADPRALVPHTSMAFPGLKKEEDRANVIAYLKSLEK